MDVDLREALAHGFGPEPPHPPVTARLDAGHRAMRRRRVAGSVLTVAVAAAVGVGAASLASGGSHPDAQVAEPAPSTATTTGGSAQEPWDSGELARYNADGMVEIRAGVTVLDRIDEPYGDPSEFNHSVALALEYRGVEEWLLLSWEADPNGGSESASGAGASPEGSFADWVAQNVAANEDNSAGYLRFADDGSLVATHGVVILDQRHPVHLKDFTFGDEASAAALLQGPGGKRWYVVVRYAEDPDVIAVPFKTGGPDLDAFLEYAKQRYESGEGLR